MLRAASRLGVRSWQARLRLSFYRSHSEARVSPDVDKRKMTRVVMKQAYLKRKARKGKGKLLAGPSRTFRKPELKLTLESAVREIHSPKRNVVGLPRRDSMVRRGQPRMKDKELQKVAVANRLFSGFFDGRTSLAMVKEQKNRLKSAIMGYRKHLRETLPTPSEVRLVAGHKLPLHDRLLMGVHVVPEQDEVDRAAREMLDAASEALGRRENIIRMLLLAADSSDEDAFVNAKKMLGAYVTSLPPFEFLQLENAVAKMCTGGLADPLSTTWDAECVGHPQVRLHLNKKEMKARVQSILTDLRALGKVRRHFDEAKDQVRYALGVAEEYGEERDDFAMGPPPKPSPSKDPQTKQFVHHARDMWKRKRFAQAVAVLFGQREAMDLYEKIEPPQTLKLKTGATPLPYNVVDALQEGRWDMEHVRSLSDPEDIMDLLPGMRRDTSVRMDPRQFASTMTESDFDPEYEHKLQLPPDEEPSAMKERLSEQAQLVLQIEARLEQLSQVVDMVDQEQEKGIWKDGQLRVVVNNAFGSVDALKQSIETHRAMAQFFQSLSKVTDWPEHKPPNPWPVNNALDAQLVNKYRMSKAYEEGAMISSESLSSDLKDDPPPWPTPMGVDPAHWPVIRTEKHSQAVKAVLAENKAELKESIEKFEADLDARIRDEPAPNTAPFLFGRRNVRALKDTAEWDEYRRRFVKRYFQGRTVTAQDWVVMRQGFEERRAPKEAYWWKKDPIEYQKVLYRNGIITRDGKWKRVSYPNARLRAVQPLPNFPQKPNVFMDIAVNRKFVGRIVFQLRDDVCPVTCENFRRLCTGEMGMGESGVPLTYKGTRFIKGAVSTMLQGGDIQFHHGGGGETIWGREMPAENHDLQHVKGVIAMLPHYTHGHLTHEPSQRGNISSNFMIGLRELPHQDGTGVVFGRIVEGYDIAELLSAAKISRTTGIMLDDVRIMDCGVIPLEKTEEHLRVPEALQADAALVNEWKEDARIPFFSFNGEPPKAYLATNKLKKTWEKFKSKHPPDFFKQRWKHLNRGISEKIKQVGAMSEHFTKLGNSAIREILLSKYFGCFDFEDSSRREAAIQMMKTWKLQGDLTIRDPYLVKDPADGSDRLNYKRLFYEHLKNKGKDPQTQQLAYGMLDLETRMEEHQQLLAQLSQRFDHPMLCSVAVGRAEAAKAAGEPMVPEAAQCLENLKTAIGRMQAFLDESVNQESFEEVAELNRRKAWVANVRQRLDAQAIVVRDAALSGQHDFTVELVDRLAECSATFEREAEELQRWHAEVIHMDPLLGVEAYANDEKMLEWLESKHELAPFARQLKQDPASVNHSAFGKAVQAVLSPQLREFQEATSNLDSVLQGQRVPRVGAFEQFDNVTVPEHLLSGTMSEDQRASLLVDFLFDSIGVDEMTGSGERTSLGLACKFKWDRELREKMRKAQLHRWLLDAGEMDALPFDFEALDLPFEQRQYFRACMKKHVEALRAGKANVHIPDANELQERLRTEGAASLDTLPEFPLPRTDCVEEAGASQTFMDSIHPSSAAHEVRAKWEPDVASQEAMIPHMVKSLKGASVRQKELEEAKKTKELLLETKWCEEFGGDARVYGHDEREKDLEERKKANWEGVVKPFMDRTHNISPAYLRKLVKRGLAAVAPLHRLSPAINPGTGRIKNEDEIVDELVGMPAEDPLCKYEWETVLEEDREYEYFKQPFVDETFWNERVQTASIMGPAAVAAVYAEYAAQKIEVLEARKRNQRHQKARSAFPFIARAPLPLGEGATFADRAMLVRLNQVARQVEKAAPAEGGVKSDLMFLNEVMRRFEAGGDKLAEDDVRSNGESVSAHLTVAMTPGLAEHIEAAKADPEIGRLFVKRHLTDIVRQSGRDPAKLVSDELVNRVAPFVLGVEPKDFLSKEQRFIRKRTLASFAQKELKFTREQAAKIVRSREGRQKLEDGIAMFHGLHPIHDKSHIEYREGFNVSHSLQHTVPREYSVKHKPVAEGCAILGGSSTAEATEDEPLTLPLGEDTALCSEEETEEEVPTEPLPEAVEAIEEFRRTPEGKQLTDEEVRQYARQASTPSAYRKFFSGKDEKTSTRWKDAGRGGVLAPFLNPHVDVCSDQVEVERPKQPHGSLSKRDVFGELPTMEWDAFLQQRAEEKRKQWLRRSERSQLEHGKMDALETLQSGLHPFSGEAGRKGWSEAKATVNLKVVGDTLLHPPRLDSPEAPGPELLERLRAEVAIVADVPDTQLRRLASEGHVPSLLAREHMKAVKDEETSALTDEFGEYEHLLDTDSSEEETIDGVSRAPPPDAAPGFKDLYKRSVNEMEKRWELTRPKTKQELNEVELEKQELQKTHPAFRAVSTQESWARLMALPGEGLSPGERSLLQSLTATSQQLLEQGVELSPSEAALHDQQAVRFRALFQLNTEERVGRSVPVPTLALPDVLKLFSGKKEEMWRKLLVDLPPEKRSLQPQVQLLSELVKSPAVPSRLKQQLKRVKKIVRRVHVKVEALMAKQPKEEQEMPLPLKNLAASGVAGANGPMSQAPLFPRAPPLKSSLLDTRVVDGVYRETEPENQLKFNEVMEGLADRYLQHDKDAQYLKWVRDDAEKRWKALCEGAAADRVDLNAILAKLKACEYDNEVSSVVETWEVGRRCLLEGIEQEPVVPFADAAQASEANSVSTLAAFHRGECALRTLLSLESTEETRHNPMLALVRALEGNPHLFDALHCAANAGHALIGDLLGGVHAPALTELERRRMREHVESGILTSLDEVKIDETDKGVLTSGELEQRREFDHLHTAERLLTLVDPTHPGVPKWQARLQKRREMLERMPVSPHLAVLDRQRKVALRKLGKEESKEEAQALATSLLANPSLSPDIQSTTQEVLDVLNTAIP